MRASRLRRAADAARRLRPATPMQRMSLARALTCQRWCPGDVNPRAFATAHRSALYVGHGRSGDGSFAVSDVVDGESDEWAEEDDEGADKEASVESDSGEPELDAAPLTLNTGGVHWGVAALEVAKEVLGSLPAADLAIFSFHIHTAHKRIDVRLDKLDDLYGSPSLQDIEDFSRSYYQAMEAKLGIDFMGQLSMDVSSPGAERQVRFPEELSRFASLPMRVCFATGENSETVLTKVLQLKSEDTTAGVSEWTLADVKANRLMGRPKLTRKAASEVFRIPVAAIRKVNLHLDF